MGQDSHGFVFPKTVTRDALLEDGSDQRLRRLLYEVTALASLIEQMRAQFAKRLGVSKPQYNILLYIAQHQGTSGLTVAQVAKALRVTGPHVTTEAGTLHAKGLLQKISNPNDGRSVLLKVTEKGAQEVEELSKVLRQVNDQLFGSLSKAEFIALSENIHTLLADAEDTLAQLPQNLRQG